MINKLICFLRGGHITFTPNYKTNKVIWHINCPRCGKKLK